MKSPLVEALRQASGADETEQPEETKPDAAAAAAQPADESEHQPDATELELMETSAGLRLEGGILPIDGGGILPIDGGGILPIDGAADVAVSDSGLAANEGTDEPEATDAVFEETTTLQVGDDSAVTSPAMETHAPPVLPPVTDAQSHSRIPRLGLYSPVLCLFLAAATAGGYFAYQRVGGWYQNSDLEMLPSQVGVPMAPASEQQDEVQGFESRFEIIKGPRAAPRRTTAAVAPSSDNAGGGKVTPRTAYTAPVVVAGRSFEDRAFAELNQAYAAFERGDYAAAEAAYRRALEIAPRHPNALQGLAAVLQRSGELTEALQHYEMLLAVEPNNTAAAVALLTGRGDEAGVAGESDIKHLIQSHPESAHLQFALGSLYARESRWAEARHAFDKASRLDPGNADYLFNLAVSLEHLSQYLDARYYYESALAVADATSALDSSVVEARIEKLQRLANPENLVR